MAIVQIDIVKDILWKMANGDPAYPVEDSISMSRARLLARKYAKEKKEAEQPTYSVSNM